MKTLLMSFVNISRGSDVAGSSWYQCVVMMMLLKIRGQMNHNDCEGQPQISDGLTCQLR